MASGVKRIVIDLREEDHEYLKKLKGNKTWRDFIFELVNFKQKAEKESDYISKTSLKTPYIAMAKALNELGKLMIEEEEDFRFDTEFYLASLLPLLVSGEKIDEDDLKALYVLVTNLVFEYIKKRYRGDRRRFAIFEYLRVAIIRELKGDTETFGRFLREVCKEIGEH